MDTKNDYGIDFNSWPLDLLVIYIEKTHHRFVEQKTPVLIEYLNRIMQGARKQPSGIVRNQRIVLEKRRRIGTAYEKRRIDLISLHQKNDWCHETYDSIEPPLFGTVNNPIKMMVEDHANEGERFRKIAALTNNYTAPADACNTYRVTYAMLEEFEQDLHKHVHLETNILFPKAKALEKFFSDNE